MGKSYDKVVGTLMELEYPSLEKLVLERLHQVRVFDYEFDIFDKTKVMTRIRYGHKDLFERNFLVPSGSIWIEFSDFLPAQEINQAFQRHFGKKSCPTYNCNSEKVCTLFRSVIFDRLQINLSQEKTKVRDEFEKLMLDLAKSDECIQASQRYRDRQAIDGIKAAIKKFPVTEELLKQALNEYLVGQTLEA